MSPRITRNATALRTQADVVKRRVGRRGAALMLLGVSFLLLALSFFLDPNGPSVDVYQYAVSLFPLSFWGGVFSTVGLVAVATSFTKIGRDAWGFGALTALCISWSGLSFLNFFVLDAPRGLLTGMIWAVIAGLIIIISGMRGVDDD